MPARTGATGGVWCPVSVSPGLQQLAWGYSLFGYLAWVTWASIPLAVHQWRSRSGQI